MTNGDVAIDNDGISAYFSLQPNGSFAPEAGDEATTLTSTAAPTSSSRPTARPTSSTPTARWITSQDTTATASRPATTPGPAHSLTDSNGEYLDLTYNAQGHLATLTDSNGQTETYGYDPTGQFLTSYTDVYGTTTYTYVTGESAAQNNALADDHLRGRHADVSSATIPTAGLSTSTRTAGPKTKRFAYLTPAATPTTDGDGNTTTVYFDLYGAPAVTIDPLGNVTRNYYDNNLD